MCTNSVSNDFSVANAFTQGMDLETALMMIQSRRVELLDQQLKDQLELVEKRNKQIAALNEILPLFSPILGYFGTDEQGKNLEDATANKTEDEGAKAALNSLITALDQKGLRDKTTGLVSLGDSSIIISEDSLANTYGELTGLQTKIKGMIDAQSNSQQIDMLRLQSLSNKRNEAYDLMSNFVKKMQDGKSSIIANMR